MTPSAPASAAAAAASGVPMPKPSATGTSVAAFVRARIAGEVAGQRARARPVVPVTETV